MKIYTNLDFKIFKDVINTINKHQDELNNLECSIVILEPNTSNILMIQGGKNYELL